MAIVLADLLDAKHVDLEMRERTQENAFRHLIGLLDANGQLSDAGKFLDHVMKREATSSSPVEHGVAFPHARTDTVEKIVLAIGRSNRGIPFGTGRARLIFLIGVPQRLVSDYLICVGALARIAKDDAIRTELLRAKTKEEFLETLRSNATTF